MNMNTNYYAFTQNGVHLDYSSLKDFTLSPAEVRRLCANMETFYTERIYELLEKQSQPQSQSQTQYVPKYYPENRDKLSGHKRKYREIE